MFQQNFFCQSRQQKQKLEKIVWNETFAIKKDFDVFFPFSSGFSLRLKRRSKEQLEVTFRRLLVDQQRLERRP